MALNFPASPVNGQIYFDPTSGNRYVYDAATTKWSYTANNTPTGSVYLSNTAPPGAVAGDLWWNSDLGTMFIFYADGDSTQWVETSPSGGFSDIAATFTIANSAFSVANAAYTNSNTAFNVANAAFNSANNVAPQVAPSYNTANAAYVVANSAYNFANGVATNAAAAFAAANNVAPQVTPAFNTANAAYTVANAAFGVANSALAAANQAGVVANNANTFAISSFVRKSGDTITGDLVVQGNVTISGNTTYANTQTLLIGDNILTLNADLPAAVAPSEDAGIEIRRGSSANVSLLWNEGSDRWTFTNDGTNYRLIASNTDVESANNYAGAMANSVNGAFATADSGVRAYVNTSSVAANNYAGVMANSANAIASATYSTLTQFGSVFGVANGAFGFANGVATNTTAAFARANSALANTSGVTFAGSLYFPTGSSVGIGTTSSIAPLHINSDNTGANNFARFIVNESQGRAGLIQGNSSIGLRYSAISTDLTFLSERRIFYRTSNGQGSGHIFQVEPTTGMVWSANNSFTNFMDINCSYVPTANWGAFNLIYAAGTINQTGSANGNYTGIYLDIVETSARGPNNRLIDLRTDGTSRFYVSNTGNTYVSNRLGIGTTSPNSELQITSGAPIITIQDNSSAEPTTIAYMRFQYNAGTLGFVGYDGLNTGALELWNNYASGNVLIATANTERMRITSAGDVGIGNTAPKLKLEVAGNMSVDAFVENSANIATSYTITAGRNAMTAGPVTLNTGVVVEVPAGSTWTVV